ncbi:prmA, partial [Mucuna pruriens]
GRMEHAVAHLLILVTYFLQICISSIFPEVEDINLSISHAADSIGLKEIPKYEVKVNEEDWMKRSQANLCFFHSSIFLFIACFSCYITEEIKTNESFRPVQVTEGLWVVPKWCTPPDVQATNIIVNPGLAFGTGEHASTKLCLLLLHGCIKGGEHILDYGTGTGILAIAALKEHTNDHLSVKVGPDLTTWFISHKNMGSSPIIDWEQFDVVIANILLNPLLDLADQIISCAKPGAVIGLSGFLSEQVQYIMERYSPFLEGIEVSKMDDWACVSGRKSRYLNLLFKS